VKLGVLTVPQDITVSVRSTSLIKSHAQLAITVSLVKCILELVLKELPTLGKKEINLRVVTLALLVPTVIKLVLLGMRTTSVLLATIALIRLSLLLLVLLELGDLTKVDILLVL
jgi:hypothetical protein